MTRSTIANAAFTKTTATRKSAKGEAQKPARKRVRKPAAPKMTVAPPSAAPKQHWVTSRAMLVRLNISMWQGAKNDRRVADEVAQHHGSDAEMGRFTKSLVEKSALKALWSRVTAMRNHIYEETLPWYDDGMGRILTSASFEGFQLHLAGLIREFDEEADKFADNYGAAIEDARKRLNGLFDESDYPPAAVIRSRFNASLSYSPLPNGDDFRADIADADAMKIRAMIEKERDDAIAAAAREVWGRLHTGITTMIERLGQTKTDDEGKTLGTFRDSAVENVRHLVDLLGRINITGDTELDAMRQRVQAELCALNGPALREDATERAVVINKAQKIVEDMSAFMA